MCSKYHGHISGYYVINCLKLFAVVILFAMAMVVMGCTCVQSITAIRTSNLVGNGVFVVGGNHGDSSGGAHLYTVHAKKRYKSAETLLYISADLLPLLKVWHGSSV